MYLVRNDPKRGENCPISERRKKRRILSRPLAHAFLVPKESFVESFILIHLDRQEASRDVIVSGQNLAKHAKHLHIT